MKLEPLYAENIIVGLIYNKIWEWYVTEKDLWFLDYYKLRSAYFERGYTIEQVNQLREGIEILDNMNLETFLKQILIYRVSQNELSLLLKTRLIERNSLDDVLDFVPSLLIDFDRKYLCSMFPEPASFEEYIPEGWRGEFIDFLNMVPNNQRYWMDESGKNLLIKL